MTRIVYIDSRKAFELAKEEAGTRLLTDISPLAAHASLRGRVEDIERLLTQDDANAIGNLAIDLAIEMDKELERSKFPESLGFSGTYCRLGGGTSRLTSGLLHRASALSRFLARKTVSSVSLVTVDIPYGSEEAAPIPSRFGSPFPVLADFGFFGAREVLRTTYKVALPFEGKPDFTVRGLRRIAHLPLSVLAYEAIAKLGLEDVGRGRELLVGAENEALRETLPWLRLFGYRIRRVKKFKLEARDLARPPHPDEIAETKARLVRLVEPAASGPLGFTGEQASAVAQLIADMTVSGLMRAARRMASLREQVASLVKDQPHPRIFLTNGLFGIEGAQTYALMREAGVTVVDFEHGVTTGLSAHSQRKIGFSEASTSDVMFVCSETAKSAFEEAGRGPGLSIHATGIADQTKYLLRPRLQRYLSRRALGISKSRQPVVMHVSTWPHSGNMRPGYGTPTEAAVVDVRRALIENVYGGLKKLVVFKDYPTRRFIDEPQPEELFTMSPNIIFPPFEDLRYIRAAADVMVTSSPTSTFGWVLGSQVPVIWLESKRVNPLLRPSQNDEFRAAFITIDLDEKTWEDELRKLLSLPIAEIREIWQKKSAERLRLAEKSVFGASTCSGLAAARVIRRMLKQIEA